ncbi:unnamed protein product [Haemonchus placei]|uniref:Spermatogenesis associated 32 n=1 Tax=Haemonchus placei TaxID=6290 RepID=A0A0N4VSD0_HAEPC|nr:unnamed protein product [Haemonchus placei]
MTYTIKGKHPQKEDLSPSRDLHGPYVKEAMQNPVTKKIPQELLCQKISQESSTTHWGFRIHAALIRSSEAAWTTSAAMTYTIKGKHPQKEDLSPSRDLHGPYVKEAMQNPVTKKIPQELLCQKISQESSTTSKVRFT